MSASSRPGGPGRAGDKVTRIDREATAAAYADGRFKDKKKRSYIRPDGRVYRFGVDVEPLRREVFQRSNGFCEMPLRGVLNGLCNRNIFWETFELHHEPPKSRGGDDSPEGTRASCRRCHVQRHGRVLRFGERVAQ